MKMCFVVNADILAYIYESYTLIRVQILRRRAMAAVA